MLRRYETFYSPALGRPMELLLFGHFGPPLLAFPSASGRFFDWENYGMIDAAAAWLERGKVRVLCVDGIDQETWLNHGANVEARGRRHQDYETYVLDQIVPFIRRECDLSEGGIAVAGCSLGAYHAANFALKFPQVFNYALCMSGRYNLEAVVGPSESLAVYYNNPVAYAANLHGDALAEVRSNTHLALVCGQGAWEDKCLAETHRLANILAAKGISHERDLWGHDVEHHWYWWKRQLAHYLGKALG
jgi:esterase/lipase superfamily enzyme